MLAPDFPPWPETLLPVSPDPSVSMVLEGVARFLDQGPSPDCARQGRFSPQYLAILHELGAFSFMRSEEQDGLGAGPSDLIGLLDLVTQTDPALAFLLLDHGVALFLLKDKETGPLGEHRIFSSGLLPHGLIPGPVTDLVLHQPDQQDLCRLILIEKAGVASQLSDCQSFGLRGLDFQRLVHASPGGDPLSILLATETTAQARNLLWLGLGRIAATLTRRAFQLARDHAALRIQFKRPLDANQMIRNKLVAMELLLFQMEALITVALEVFPSNPAPGPARLAFSFAADGACASSEQAMQIFGGNGFMEETGLPDLVRDSRGLRLSGQGLIQGNPKNCSSAPGNLSRSEELPEAEKLWLDKALLSYLRYLNQGGAPSWAPERVKILAGLLGITA